MTRTLELSDDERKRRSEAMRDLNRSGRRGKRRSKTDDERIRESLMQIVKTGTPRQRLDATRELAALDERSPARRPDFEDMTPSELDSHIEGLVLRMVEHWASTRRWRRSGKSARRGAMPTSSTERSHGAPCIPNDE